MIHSNMKSSAHFAGVLLCASALAAGCGDDSSPDSTENVDSGTQTATPSDAGNGADDSAVDTREPTTKPTTGTTASDAGVATMEPGAATSNNDAQAGPTTPDAATDDDRNTSEPGDSGPSVTFDASLAQSDAGAPEIAEPTSSEPIDSSGPDASTAPTGGADAASVDGLDASTPTDAGLDGSVDTQDGPQTFVLSATGHDRFYGVTYAPDGSIYAVGQLGSSSDSNVDLALLLAKFTPDGKLDASFGAGGLVVKNVATGTSGELFRGVVVQSSGKIVVSGSVEHAGAADARDRDIAVLRFNIDGTLDATFGTAGVALFDLSTGVVNGTNFSADSAWGLVRYDDDRLVVSGGRVREGNLDTDFVLLRLTPEGALDTSFSGDGIFSLDTQIEGVSNPASPRNVTLLPNGEGLIGAGYQPIPGADTAPVLYKVDDDGNLVTSFGNDGVFSERVLSEQAETYAAAVQPEPGGGYKLVTTGYGRELEEELPDLVSLRVTSDGQLDPSYGVDGVVRIDVGGFGDNSRKLSVLPDGRVMLIGGGRPAEANVDGLVAILTPDGDPYEPFSESGYRLFDFGGPADFLWGVALSPDNTTAALVGIRGVGMTPVPASANDDAVLFRFTLPE